MKSPPQSEIRWCIKWPDGGFSTETFFLRRAAIAKRNLWVAPENRKMTSIVRVRLVEVKPRPRKRKAKR